LDFAGSAVGGLEDGVGGVEVEIWSGSAVFVSGLGVRGFFTYSKRQRSCGRGRRLDWSIG